MATNEIEWVGIRRGCSPSCVKHSYQEGPVAIICSCHFNAVGIALSLREVGWQGPIVCLKINVNEAVVAERFLDLCECWSLTINAPEELPCVIVKRVPASRIGSVFFCDERFLHVFGTDKVVGMLPHARMCTGPKNYHETILDRRLFYQRIQGALGVDVPLTVDSGNNPFKVFGVAFRTRVWRSWRGLEKLPRGRTIRSKKELCEWKRLCQDKGLSEEEWGYQELLSTTPKDVVSVCGWYGPLEEVHRTTRWVKQSGENGWLVEATEDHPELWETTKHILDLLGFGGPYELEFVRNARTGKFYVIELNPRFWMQHRLVGNVLVRRYLGLPDDKGRPISPARYWINTDTALSLASIFRHPDLVKYLAHPVWAVPLRRSIWPAVRRAAGSILNHFAKLA